MLLGGVCLKPQNTYTVTQNIQKVFHLDKYEIPLYIKQFKKISQYIKKLIILLDKQDNYNNRKKVMSTKAWYSTIFSGVSFSFKKRRRI